MANKVVLGINDAALAAEVRALLDEGTDVEVVGTATTAPAVVDACEQTEVDVVLLHEGIGPLPLLHVTRDLGARFPGIGVVLLVQDPTPDLLRGALQAGARGVASLPLSLDALEADLGAAASWSRSMRSRFAGSPRAGDVSAGGSRMFAVAGAKGGVGTTSIALHLALEAATRLAPARSVCLVDFDLQAGDVGTYLDLEHRRSVVDLLEVSEDLSARHLDEALFRHPSGLHVLLAPPEGEHAEDVSAAPARQILGAIRSRFDVIVVDVGTVVTEGSAVAVEMADAVVLLTTPDVPSMRSANRLLGLWERIDARKEGIRVLVNRASRISDVQPDLVDAVVGAPRVPVTVPADYKGLQASLNSGAPDRAADTGFRAAVEGLGAHLDLWVGAPRRGGSSRRLFGRGDGGQAVVEFVGVLPLLLLMVAVAFQLALVGMTFLFAGHAASEAAAHLSVGRPPAVVQQEVAGRLPARWAGTLALATRSSSSTNREVEAALQVPILVVPYMAQDLDIVVRSTSGYVDEDAISGALP